MWNSGPLVRQTTEDERPRFPLHNIDESGNPVTPPEEEHEAVERFADADDGTWGERDVGGPLDAGSAMEGYQQLRKTLSGIERQKSRSSLKSQKSRDGHGLQRITSRGSARNAQAQPQQPDLEQQQTRTTDAAEDKEEAEDADDDDFALDEFMREGHFEKRVEGRSAKKVGVVFKNLTVKGVGATATSVKTVPEAVLGTFGPDLFRIVMSFLPASVKPKPKNLRVLVNDFTGLVRDGEMMLVLGRPGSGCSTFLKAIANNRDSYAAVEGQVSYGGIDAAVQKKLYRGEVNYNPEDDVHFPELNVWQTFKFALLNKTKKRDKKEIPVIIEALMKMFGISHTKYTPVGNEYVRGVSGGERKRVSIAETLATKSTVLCWDNSTRGLDASTALDYAKSLRIMTDVSNKATLTTLYQAGEGIYEQMDKVLVIDAGRCIYQGPATEARQYFIDLGFDAPPRQTTADFLTACTDPVERRFRPGFEEKCPKTAEELEAAFKKSPNFQKVLDDVSAYEKELQESNYADAREFEETVREGKSHRTVSKKSPYTVSFSRQVMACAQRELWLLWGDKTTLYTKAFIIVSNALIVGSLFYGQPLNTEGTFSRGGSIFFGIIFLGWLQLTELMKAVSGRGVVSRQHDYAFYRPSAVTIARVLTDFPILAPQTLIFSVITYFMYGLDVTASKFWIYTLFVYTSTIMLTAMYRMFASVSGSIDDAVRFSGIALNLLLIFTGYVIPRPELLSNKIWFGWIYWINPLSYAFEGVVTNEFSDRNMECAQLQLVPQGPNIDPAHQSCALTGAGVDAHTVQGADYLSASFAYSRSNLWRNFGVVIAFTVLYILVNFWASETFNFAQEGGGALVFKKTSKSKKQLAAPPVADEEKGGKAEDSSASSERTQSGDEPAKGERDALNQISSSQQVFTWENVNYSVPYQGGERQLLNNVSGYAKPGVMVALMGASGAGKTTLLNTLAQRQTVGVVSGDMLVDGRKLGTEFQRGTGFCEQMDLHDGTATVKEALEFSALLRQERTVPRQEKLDYVQTVLDLLELNEIQDAIISSLGVEQRKRLTIGVELAAKPSLLLFLDEPTSGLDSQSAYSIVHFLRKLAHAGQAIICTIHQPSSVLIQQFDMILALNPGGNTFYFGPVGENGSAVVKYFADKGFECPENKNIAEFILEIAAKSRRRPDGSKVDWNEEWRRSSNAQAVLDEIQRIKQERGQIAPKEASEEHEFAAPVFEQSYLLTLRTFRQHWRDPSYLYGKLFTAVIVGIFNGFTFWQLGNSTIDLQDRMFSAFLILTIPPTVVNAVVPKFFQNMMLWQARELPSRIYGWFAFCTAQVICEIPEATISAVLYFVLWYFASGLPYESSVSGYVFFMTWLFFMFMSSWGQWITAFAPSFTVISNVLPFFFVMFSLFNGVVRPYASLPVFWRYWMYYVNPSTYWIGGVLAATLDGIPVVCSPDETAKFTPPPGQSCETYGGTFANMTGGYYIDPSSTSLCEYCMYSQGNDYLSSLNLKASDKWPYFGIFVAFTISNWALVYFFVYTVRIKGWSFGMDYLFNFCGFIFKGLFWPFKKLGQTLSRRRGE